MVCRRRCDTAGTSRRPRPRRTPATTTASRNSATKSSRAPRPTPTSPGYVAAGPCAADRVASGAAAKQRPVGGQAEPGHTQQGARAPADPSAPRGEHRVSGSSSVFYSDGDEALFMGQHADRETRCVRFFGSRACHSSERGSPLNASYDSMRQRRMLHVSLGSAHSIDEAVGACAFCLAGARGSDAGVVAAVSAAKRDAARAGRQRTSARQQHAVLHRRCAAPRTAAGPLTLTLPTVQPQGVRTQRTSHAHVCL